MWSIWLVLLNNGGFPYLFEANSALPIHTVKCLTQDWVPTNGVKLFACYVSSVIHSKSLQGIMNPGSLLNIKHCGWENFIFPEVPGQWISAISEIYSELCDLFYRGGRQENSSHFFLIGFWAEYSRIFSTFAEERVDSSSDSVSVISALFGGAVHSILLLYLYGPAVFAGFLHVG